MGVLTAAQLDTSSEATRLLRTLHCRASNPNSSPCRKAVRARRGCLQGVSPHQCRVGDRSRPGRKLGGVSEFPCNRG